MGLGDGVTTYSCFEKYLCGQAGQSLTKNVRDMALLELAFQGIDAVALLFTVADEGGLNKKSDQLALFTLLVSAPTLGVLLWYVLRRHPDAHFLRGFNMWCVLMLALYVLGVADDVMWVASASRQRTWPRTVTLIVDVFSLALFGNIVYFNVQLLRRIQQSQSPAASETSKGERSPLANGVVSGEAVLVQEQQ